MATTSTMIQMDHWSSSQAALSDAERTSVNALSNWLASETSSSSKTYEAAGSSSNGMPSRPTTASSLRVPGPSLPSAPLSDAPLYLSWFAKQQSHITSSSQSSHAQALQFLSQAADEADVLLDHLEAARVHISELRAGARFVEEGSEGLREEAESMVEKIVGHLSLRRQFDHSTECYFPGSSVPPCTSPGLAAVILCHSSRQYEFSFVTISISRYLDRLSLYSGPPRCCPRLCRCSPSLPRLTTVQDAI